MTKFKFKVKTTTYHETVVDIEAGSFEEAQALLDKDLEECPIDTRSNTFAGKESEITELSDGKGKEVETYEPQEGEKFARKCDVTGEGMNDGFVFGDGEKYIKHEEDALAYAKEQGYTDLEKSYADDHHYWTNWEMPAEAKYIIKDGKLVEI